MLVLGCMIPNIKDGVVDFAQHGLLNCTIKCIYHLFVINGTRNVLL